MREKKDVENVNTEPVKSDLETVSQLLAELSPEELEPRFELQVLIDPMASLLDTNNNNNGSCGLLADINNNNNC